MTITTSPSRLARPVRERGISLLFALLALVSLSLAAVAVVRSVDTSAQVMGNLGFKQDATSSADKAVQEAITKLVGLNRNTDNIAEGYYAVAHESIDATGQDTSNASRELINWGLNSCADATNASLATCVVSPSPEREYNGNKLRYVIFRLCSTTGTPDTPGNACARPKLITASSGSGSSGGTAVTTAPKKGELKYGEELRLVADPGVPAGSYQGVYYRIVVRVIGARNTTSFVETIVHL